MEEQDLQMMIMTNQKASPLQYLIASTMQDRVHTAVEKSQVCPLLLDQQHLKGVIGCPFSTSCYDSLGS